VVFGRDISEPLVGGMSPGEAGRSTVVLGECTAK
jgi:hypothetical protein